MPTLGAPSLLPRYSLLPVPSLAADDTCLRTGQGPFQGRPNRIAARASTSSSWPSSPSRTARRGAEGTEAGNFRGGPIKGHLSGLSGLSKKKEIKGTVASGAIRSQHVISIKSRRPRRRFSLSHPPSLKRRDQAVTASSRSTTSSTWTASYLSLHRFGSSCPSAHSNVML